LKVQRLRFRYRVTDQAGSLNNREIAAIWADAITSAGFSVACSEGRRTTPQVSIAAPLPTGVTSECEIADVYLSEPADPEAVLAALPAHLPPGVEALAVQEIGVGAPSLQSQLRWAEYMVTLLPSVDRGNASRSVERLLAADSLPSEYHRANRVKSYDLRPLIITMDIEEREGALALRMRLRAEPERAARADQVVLALELPEAEQILRTRLELSEVSEIGLAHRRSSFVEGT
jgi:radical SAM-linked protein